MEMIKCLNQRTKDEQKNNQNLKESVEQYKLRRFERDKEIEMKLSKPEKKNCELFYLRFSFNRGQIQK